MKSLDERSGSGEVVKESEKALDIEEDAKDFSRKVIKGLVDAVKETEDEDLKKTLHDIIRCFARFYTLPEMGPYFTPGINLALEKMIRIYIKARMEDLHGAKAYIEYSEHRQALRVKEAVPVPVPVSQNVQLSEIEQHILAIQQNKPAHVCGPDCNHDVIDEPSTSQVKPKPRNPRKP